MKILFVFEQIRIQVAKYSEFLSLNINRVPLLVPSLMTPPPPHNRVQNKHVLHRCRVFTCALFKDCYKPTGTLADLIGLDSIGVNTL